MQMVKKSIFVLFVVWFAVIVFMPKQELYYQFEQQLEQEDVKIASEKIEEGWFTLTLKDPVIYVRGIKVATVESISIFTVLGYSSVQVEGVILDASLQSFAPGSIDEAHLTHLIVFPQRLSLSANGLFGEAEGEILLDARRLKIHFSDNSKLGMLRAQLKKDEEGWQYETAF